MPVSLFASANFSPQQCLDRCLTRYFEAFNIVSTSYVRRVAAERNTGATLDMAPAPTP